jgi:hypothetical protein
MQGPCNRAGYLTQEHSLSYTHRRPEERKSHARAPGAWPPAWRARNSLESGHMSWQSCKAASGAGSATTPEGICGYSRWTEKATGPSPEKHPDRQCCCIKRWWLYVQKPLKSTHTDASPAEKPKNRIRDGQRQIITMSLRRRVQKSAGDVECQGKCALSYIHGPVGLSLPYCLWQISQRPIVLQQSFPIVAPVPQYIHCVVSIIW